jgi:hypothetical protein
VRVTLLGRRLTLLQTVLVVVATVAPGFATTVATAAFTSRGYADPSVIVLGSGDQLSVLVTDGSGRLLLASGNDPAAFGNALAQTRPLGRNRIDVLLLAGTTSDVTFLSRASRKAKGRHIEAIGKPDLVGALALPPDALLLSPRRFRLSPEMRVIVETIDRADAREGPAFAWRATIEHDATRIVVLSDGRVAGEFPDPGPVAALVVDGAQAVQGLDRVETSVLVVSGEAVSGKDLRGDVAEAARHRTWVLRVFAGETQRFAFTQNGLALPAGAQPIDATPRAQAGDR